MERRNVSTILSSTCLEYCNIIMIFHIIFYVFLKDLIVSFEHDLIFVGHYYLVLTIIARFEQLRRGPSVNGHWDTRGSWVDKN
jgi:hypothetical protein